MKRQQSSKPKRKFVKNSPEVVSSGAESPDLLDKSFSRLNVADSNDYSHETQTGPIHVVQPTNGTSIPVPHSGSPEVFYASVDEAHHYFNNNHPHQPNPYHLPQLQPQPHIPLMDPPVYYLHSSDSSNSTTLSQQQQPWVPMYYLPSGLITPLVYTSPSGPVTTTATAAVGGSSTPLSSSAEFYHNLAQPPIQISLPAHVQQQLLQNQLNQTRSNNHSQLEKSHPSKASTSTPNNSTVDTNNSLGEAAATILTNFNKADHPPRSNCSSPSSTEFSERELKSRVAEAISSGRNVYIRGLPTHTTDEKLASLCSQFGPIESSKAILEHIPTKSADGTTINITGLCKGYGFVMYESLADVPGAIKQLNELGFEASVAKESFSNRLKTLQSESQTNIYLSNLPVAYTETDLARLCEKYISSKVKSAKILRSGGISRGVGFARVEDHKTAAELINILNGLTVPGCACPLQVRFADNPMQKKLKGSSTRRKLPNPSSTLSPSAGLFIGSPSLLPQT